MKTCLFCNSNFESRDWICPICGKCPELNNGFFALLLDKETDSGFDPSNFSKLVNLEENNFWFRSRNKLLTSSINNYFPNAVNFLEIGCGTGFVLSGIEKGNPKLDLSGSDLFCEGLEYAKKRVPSATFYQMDARYIPFESEFDVIGAFDVLEHIDNDDDVLKQIYKACNVGGGIIITVPQHNLLWSKMDEYAHHKRRYNARDLKNKIEKFGFKVLRLTSFVTILLPLMIASRITIQYIVKEINPMSEFNIGYTLNNILEKILDLERFLILSGVSFPVGGSLLLIASKGTGRILK